MPTLPTAIHQWPINEGTGDTLTDVIGDAPLLIYSSGGYPQWLPDEDGLRFSGGGMGAGYAYDPLNTGNCPSTKAGPFAICAWFNLRGNTNRASFGGRNIFAVSNFVSRFAINYFQFRHPLQDFLYVGNLGHVGFAGHYDPAASDYTDGAIGVTDLTGSNEWHHILGYLAYPYATVYLDGVLEGTFTAIYAKQETSYRGFCLGSGSTYMAPPSGTADQNAPELVATSNGTFPGDIRDARMYCGPLTPEDVWLIYTNPSPITLIGHCPGLGESSLCVPRSTSRSCAPQSSSSVIVRTSSTPLPGD